MICPSQGHIILITYFEVYPIRTCVARANGVLLIVVSHAAFKREGFDDFADLTAAHGGFFILL